mmetsp:Transcript_122660/g.192502  ORF Transcript_122660/g.192502 Transcript_122660/m.192502 type:complete len:106 (+) Transcript_122660:67-384(+)|eukprot:CAMPEP_0169173294 /NCGR_PEP_ID=MMETSP1015-20121227/63839_1 /TAXON_ID=342587 /ORGANISM="Karlodinium micrum, Strain CCMP2283" /LENGTH=105 /DNA_ID=CAMNT_0009246883 /DNA_START=52 /DNA_END=369 /DNA_ORIENTATION=-
MSEVEEAILRIRAHKSVAGLIVLDKDGEPIRHTLKPDHHPPTITYARIISQLATKAKSIVRDLDPQNDLEFLRIRAKKLEIMVAPGPDYLLIVIQDPNAEAVQGQ